MRAKQLRYGRIPFNLSQKRSDNEKMKKKNSKENPNVRAIDKGTKEYLTDRFRKIYALNVLYEKGNN